MRILLINKFHYRKGGAERAYFDTARILAENGHEVAFFAMEHPDNEPTPCAPYFVSQVDYLDGEQSLLSKLKVASRIVWNFEASRKLKALIGDFQPDIAHLHNTYHQLSPSILWTLKRARVPIVMTLHDYKSVSPNYSLFVRGKIWEHTSGWRTLIDRAVKNSYLKSLVCALEQWLHTALKSYSLVGQFIAPSRFLIDEYRKLGFPYPIEHVPQPLAPFPLPPTTFGQGEYFLFAGRLSQEKGVATLLRAFALLPHERLVIAGTGPDEVVLKQFQDEAGLTNVVFVGHQTGETLEATFRGAKAFIIPSEWYENMPYVVLEALSYGLPVIGSNLGGIPERIQDSANGFLFEAGNPESLAQAIQRFSAFDLAALGRNAWESIQDLHEESYLVVLETVYNQLLASVDKNTKKG